MAQNRLPLLLGMLFALSAVVLVWWWSTRPRAPESLEALARQALEADSPEKQQQAAVKLQSLAARLPKTGPRNAAQPYLIRVFRTSKNPAVRVPCMMGLAGIWDYDCMPTMLELLDDESALLRGAAAKAIFKLADRELIFNAKDPPEKRKEQAAKIRDMWKLFAERNLPHWLKKLAENDAKL